MSNPIQITYNPGPPASAKMVDMKSMYVIGDILEFDLVTQDVMPNGRFSLSFICTWLSGSPNTPPQEGENPFTKDHHSSAPEFEFTWLPNNTWRTSATMASFSYPPGGGSENWSIIAILNDKTTSEHIHITILDLTELPNFRVRSV